MDSDIEDLESLLSEHFGRTPCTTPCGSQEYETVLNELAVTDLDSDSEQPEVNVDQICTLYLHNNNSDEEDVEEGATGCDNDETELTSTSRGDEEENQICNYRTNGCGCKDNCVKHFTDSDIYEHILNTKEMEKQDKELYIMSTLIDSSDKDVTKRGKKRKRVRHEYTFLGRPVCRAMFMLAFDVKYTYLRNIMSHLDEHGVSARVHGNIGRKPAKSLHFEDIKYVVSYINQTAEDIGLPQPAAPRGSDNIPPIYLPSDTTKLCVYGKYETSCREIDPPKRNVKYSTFNNIWRQCLPHIKIASPRDDVCATCEKMRKAIMDSRTEEEKLENVEVFRSHILVAQTERQAYNRCIELARESADNGDHSYVHFTFDFSQNMSIPHHARQMGPLYFISLRKVQLFGVRIDGTPKQFNFLIDENETIGIDGTHSHGPNSVISMLHWTLEQEHSDETTLYIHADNCPGHNKNQYVLGYLMWRVMSGRQKNIVYMMQVPGHARCHVDAGFATIKRLYRRTDTDSLDQLTDVVNRSSITNECVRYPAWTWYDWKAFLRPCFKPVPGIRKYQYFRMEQDNPGVVTVKESSNAEEKVFGILKTGCIQFNSTVLPNALQPGGLSDSRKKYLRSTVRPYVRPAYQDMICSGEDI